MVGQLNTHGYEYRKGRRDLLDAAARAANLPLWNSETGDNDITGMTMAQNISIDLAWLHPSVWCMWQPLDGSGWGLIYAEPENHTIGAANIKYYMMAQYTRHIRPGMIMLDSDDPNTTESLDEKTDTLVIVTVNSGPAESVTYSLNTGQQPARESWLNVRRWETDASGPNKYTEYPDSVIADTSLMVHFPARSVQTIEITKIGR